jgi:hypothetical protein
MHLFWIMISVVILFSCGLYESEGRYLFEEDFRTGKIVKVEGSSLYFEDYQSDCGEFKNLELFEKSCEPDDYKTGESHNVE